MRRGLGDGNGQGVAVCGGGESAARYGDQSGGPSQGRQQDWPAADDRGDQESGAGRWFRCSCRLWTSMVSWGGGPGDDEGVSL